MQSHAILILISSLHGLLVFASVLRNNIDLTLRSRIAGPILSRPETLISLNHNNHSTNKAPASPDVPKLTIRAADTPALTVPQFDEAAFNRNVTTACANAVANYKSAVNPSGIVACYNIASWDNTTGIFQTDTRLFMKHAGVGDFKGIDMSKLAMSFSIPEATLSSPKKVAASNSANANSPGPNQFLEGFQNVGQLSKSIQFSKLAVSDLRNLLIPTITLSANTGANVNTSLASDMISYVAGQFTQADGTPTNITAPEAAAADAAIAASASVFVLPGTHIMVFPVGLIITCVWSGLLIVAVGAGTAGRYHYRMQFRRAQPSQNFAF